MYVQNTGVMSIVRNRDKEMSVIISLTYQRVLPIFPLQKQVPN